MLSRLYYGWGIVLGAILCNFAFLSVSQSSIGVFTLPMVDDLGWKVWQYTLGPSIAIGTGAFSSIVVGSILDKRGPKPLIFTGASMSAVCLVLLGIQSSLMVYLFVYLIAGFVGWNLFSPFVVNSAVNKWFVRKRGWALALGSSGISLGSLVTPLILTGIVDNSGWRTGYFSLGVFVLVLIIPVSFFMRRTPEDYGLLPDGVDDYDDHVSSDIPESEFRPFNRSEAINTSSFWFLAFGFTLIAAGLACVLIHAIPFSQESGFARTVGAIGISVNGLANLSSKPVWGFAMQRFHPRFLVMVAYSISSIGVALMLLSGPISLIPMLLAGFFLYGFGFGGTIPLSESLWARYFGRAHIGSIRGITQPIRILGTAVAPVLVGLLFDITDTYRPGFVLVIGALLLGAILVFLSREPRMTAS
jgi:MFS family permease